MSADSASTDLLHRFSFENAPIRGQWVRLEGVLSQILAQQPYPAPVRRLLGQMLGAVSMFADGIKFEGSVTLHSQGNGPLTTLMAECRSQNLLRAIARWDRDVTLRESVPMSELLGGGQLAISLLPSEPGGANIPVSYQGLINLEQGDFAHNLEAYFATSEQLPSRLFFASGDASVTGLLIQRMPVADDATEIELDEHEALWSEVESSIQQLADTVRPAELSSLAPAVLLARLFNEHALNLHPPRDLRFECTCNRDKTAATLKTLTRSELLELLESQGQITVTCEVCGCKYRYDSVDTHMLLERGNPRIH